MENTTSLLFYIPELNRFSTSGSLQFETRAVRLDIILTKEEFSGLMQILQSDNSDAIESAKKLICLTWEERLNLLSQNHANEHNKVV